LEITVPRGAFEETLSVEGVVLQENTTFVLRSAGSDGLSGCEVNLTDFCLVPALCADYNCTSPEQWKKNASAKFGQTNTLCCSERYCKDEVDCASDESGEWRNQNHTDGSDTLMGSTTEQCCLPNLCADFDYCKDPDRQNKTGTGIRGNTAGHCCEDAVRSGTTNSPVDVGSDAQSNCSTSGVKCEPANWWTKKDDFDDILGSTPAQCCDAVMCDDYTCGEDTKYLHKDGVQGNNQTMCCTPRKCQNHSCSSHKLEGFPFDAAAPRLGSTDAECCQMKACENQSHVCQPATKWVHKADVDASNLLLRGDDDDACCNKLMCSTFSCESPSWRPKSAEDLQKDPQGSTPEECCEPVWCEDYTCLPDTKWYKKADTNTFKWQGFTHEECCLPIYCSQYETQFPSKWRRKQDKSAKGSTEPECYDPIMCAHNCPNDNYRCLDAGLVISPNAANISGSTDEECCMAPPPTTTTR